LVVGRSLFVVGWLVPWFHGSMVGSSFVVAVAVAVVSFDAAVVVVFTANIKDRHS